MTSAVVEEAHTAAWDGPRPKVTALVSTYRRPHYLPELIAALEQQTLPVEDFELVVVDNGSGDETWTVLGEQIERSPLRLLALRLERNLRPAGGRNTGASRARAPLLAITDDDCLPTSGWLAGIVDAFADDVDVVQGRVMPHPGQLEQAGPWDHTVWVLGPGPLFETCNVAYRRAAFEAVEGFDQSDPLFAPPSGRAFGEDAHLGWKVVSSGGGRGFADDALVYHRVIPSSFRARVRDELHAAGFPGLARRSPLVARWLLAGVFLTPNSAAFDAAMAGTALAAALRHPLPLIAAVPWVRRRWAHALVRVRGDRSRAAVVLAQQGAADFMMLVSLLRGSIRHRRLVL